MHMMTFEGTLRMRKVLAKGFCILLAGGAIGCAHKGKVSSPVPVAGPDSTFAQDALAKLESQSSFRFRLEFARKGGMADIDARYEGSYLFPEKGSVKGYWDMGGMREETDVIVSGDREFRLDPDTKAWTEEPANEEISPFKQLARTTGLGNFRFLASDKIAGKPALKFSFDASLAFLDPQMEKQLVGTMWANEKTGLPVKIDAGSTDGTIIWSMSLFDYNSPIEIKIPIRHKFEATFSPAGEERNGLTTSIGLLESRLSLVGLEAVHLSSKTTSKVKFEFEAENDLTALIRRVAKPGALCVRLAEWPDEPVVELFKDKVREIYGEGADLAFEQGNPAKPLILLDTVFAEKAIESVQFGYDEFSRPILDISISAEGSERLKQATASHIGKPIAFILDDKVVYAPRVRSVIAGTTVRIGGLSSISEAKSMYAMLKTGPFAVGFDLSSVEEIGTQGVPR
jgi:hypothetical protein